MIMFLDVKLGERVDYVNQLGFNSVIFFLLYKIIYITVACHLPSCIFKFVRDLKTVYFCFFRLFSSETDILLRAMELEV